MTKQATPVDLIVAKMMDDCAEKIALIPAKLIEAADPEALVDALARRLLCDISHSAGLPRVLAALAAVGAPSTGEELTSRLRAVQDVRRGEASP